MWFVWLYNIFKHYLVNGTIFGGELLNIKMSFDFLYKIVRTISHSKHNSATYN